MTRGRFCRQSVKNVEAYAQVLMEKLCNSKTKVRI
jgi:hypothetical protein